MPQQPPPQSPRPDRPTSTSPTPERAPDDTGANPQPGAPPRPAGRTPPGGNPGHAWSNGYGPAPVPARASASGGFSAVDQHVPAGHLRVTGPPPSPAPGYGPTPAYRPAPPAAHARATQALASSSADRATTAVAASAQPKKRDLTVNKLIAGAGAAGASAVLGSFFGAMGTVGGAAVGSVFSALVTSLMQHSLDKTRDTVKARVKLPGGGTVKVSSTTEVPAPWDAAGQASTRVLVTPGDQPTEVLSAVPAVDAGPPKSRRRLLVMAGFTVVVFAIGMLAVTGIELVKGSPLNTSSSSTSERSGGTSLGTVLGGSESATTDTSTETAAETAEPTSEPATSDDPANEEGADSPAAPRSGSGADEDEATPTPNPAPPASGADEETDEDSQSDQGSGSDGGAVEQPGGGAAVPDNQQ